MPISRNCSGDGSGVMVPFIFVRYSPRMARPLLLAPLALLALAAAPLAAQEAEPAPSPPVDCSAGPAALETPWESWNATPRSIDAGANVGAMPALFIGAPMTLKLLPTSAVTLASATARPLDPARSAGLATIELERAARVGIALSDAAWIDVVSRGIEQTSIEHDHGPDCSGIRKIVWFDLQAGPHVVQVVNSPKAAITVMVAVAQPVVD